MLKQDIEEGITWEMCLFSFLAVFHCVSAELPVTSRWPQPLVLLSFTLVWLISLVVGLICQLFPPPLPPSPSFPGALFDRRSAGSRHTDGSAGSRCVGFYSTVRSAHGLRKCSNNESAPFFYTVLLPLYFLHSSYSHSCSQVRNGWTLFSSCAPHRSAGGWRWE